MNKNKKINKLIIILSCIELILILFFLAYLLVYSYLIGGDSLIVSPVLYISILLICLVPLGMFGYYLSIRNRKVNSFKFEKEENDLTKSGKPINKKERSERFSELKELDRVLKNKVAQFDEVNSLKDFADAFRNYCAYKKCLYYTEKDIRSFISNLATSKTMILQGMSGTGKTSIALAFEDFIGNQTTVIAVQPMWKERSDLVGYFNEFTKKFNETPLLKELYRSNFDNQIYIIVLDEVNIARVEYYFAEFLSLLEYPNEEQRTLEITNDTWPKDPSLLPDGRLKIGNNVYFVGTANNDESTFTISDKVYDRAMIINLDKKASKFEGIEQGRVRISNENFENLAKMAVNDYQEIQKVDKWINQINVLLKEYFSINFGNRMVNQIKKYIPVYVSAGGTDIEAFDDFVAKKILRKLDGKDALKINSAIEPFLDELKSTFGAQNMVECIRYVEKFKIN